MKMMKKKKNSKKRENHRAWFDVLNVLILLFAEQEMLLNVI